MSLGAEERGVAQHPVNWVTAFNLLPSLQPEAPADRQQLPLQLPAALVT